MAVRGQPAPDFLGAGRVDHGDDHARPVVDALGDDLAPGIDDARVAVGAPPPVHAALRGGVISPNSPARVGFLISAQRG